MLDYQNLIILQHKIRALRDSVTRSLDALIDEIEGKLPTEIKSKHNNPAEMLNKLLDERKPARPVKPNRITTYGKGK
jgi:hypothetical protein